MCIAVPAKIIEIETYMKDKEERCVSDKVKSVTAKVEILGIVSRVNIQLLEEPQVGEYVLVHAGCAIKKIDEEYYGYLEMIHRAKWEELM
ncbi:hypothetical protein acsn021_36300 [Anaerocolumna cellulosilytica]|uniref:Uncharacterized protein n=1 Tax=Anaerocolumna cellulosilytica TaxID=433286 RepID=A0A6S6RB89_9FIRM|nr:HypC/HybG/HupF family hydrogenase formation chaperone [Anaerocolumna cellulosilytica]MBB5195102.1 hydrogenase expression/formation protein HypC [Anaerocolumna cellulosilytica]BCJ96061.1 hypothetical protein acsn021_36300 [Anaerocolumna cellulosilytica]